MMFIAYFRLGFWVLNDEGDGPRNGDGLRFVVRDSLCVYMCVFIIILFLF